LLAQPRLEPMVSSVCGVTYEDWNMEQKPDSWAFAVQVEFVACSAGAPPGKGFSSSATLAQTSICARLTSKIT
jgi:hypothetical protein